MHGIQSFRARHAECARGIRAAHMTCTHTRTKMTAVPAYLQSKHTTKKPQHPWRPHRRSFFNVGSFLGQGPLGGGGSGPSTKRYQETVILPYTQQELYAIVSDVDSYRQFLPYCQNSRVLGPSRSVRARANQENAKKIVDAELTIGFSAVHESYISEVSMRPYEWVRAQAKPSPLFHELHTTWQFKALPPLSPSTTTQSTGQLGAQVTSSTPRTQVSFTLAFAFSSQLYAALVGQVFESLSSRMIEAFRARAHTVYGPRRRV